MTDYARNAPASSSPGARRLSNPLLRLLGNVRFGIAMLTLVLIYASIFSALPQIRGAMELTEMKAFSHPLFTTLIVLLCISLSIVTVTRIRWNAINAGVLTVHAGILILSGGAIWYFGWKIEGDVTLRSPRVELMAVGAGPPRAVASMLAEAGQQWSAEAPALGGTIQIVLSKPDADARAATNGLSIGDIAARVQIGDAEPRDVTLTRGALVPVHERLSLRLTEFEPERTFYDVTRAALYARKADAPWRQAELAGLPIFRERYLDEGYTLNDSAGRPVVSKRTKPAASIGGFSIPTGWFEFWRMPLRVDFAEPPFNVDVTGFVPYVNSIESVGIDGGERLNPIAAVTLALRAGNRCRTVAALSPSSSRIEIAAPLEFHWVESPEQQAALVTPLAGADELTIEVLEPPLRKTVAIRKGEKITLEGSPYEITVSDLPAAWPLMSPGFENSSSAAAIVEVTGPEKQFTRTVIERFPQLSQDIDEKGMRRKDGLYDPNIILRYRSASTAMRLIASAESVRGGGAALATVEQDGQVRVVPLKIGQEERISIRGVLLLFTLNSLFERGQLIERPVIEPLATRRPNLMAWSASAIRVRLTGRGPASGWSETHWMMFNQYAHIDATPLRIRPPGGEEWELVYSRAQHDLGARLAARKLETTLFPGRMQAASWRSEFVIQPDGGAPQDAALFTNRTYSNGHLTYFQSGAATDHWSFTTLGVGNRLGIWPMLIGCIMICAGSLYAFYVKPVLIRRRAERAAVAAADRRDRPSDGGPREGALANVGASR